LKPGSQARRKGAWEEASHNLHGGDKSGSWVKYEQKSRRDKRNGNNVDRPRQKNHHIRERRGRWPEGNQGVERRPLIMSKVSALVKRKIGGGKPSHETSTYRRGFGGVVLHSSPKKWIKRQTNEKP